MRQQIIYGLSSVRKSAGLTSSIIILYTLSRTRTLFNNSALYEQESIKEEIADILTGEK